MGNRKAAQTVVNDEQIIDMYWMRDPDAIQETERKYGHFLQNMASNILSDPLDCEECQNDTYLKIWNAIPSARPMDFFAFVMQIMRRVAINRYREKSRQKRIPSRFTVSIEDLRCSISSGQTVEEEYDAKEVGEMITNYVRNLNDRQRFIFMDRYYLAEPVEKTAEELSVSIRTVYREIDKIKQGLKEYLERNGVYV